MMLPELEKKAKRLPLGEAFELIDRANTLNDFRYTQLKYKVYLERKGREELNEGKDDGKEGETLTRFAEELVGFLAVEDLSLMQEEYGRMLEGIGEPAIRPLEDFLATRGKEWVKERLEGKLYPVPENYEVMRRVRERIGSA